MTVFPTVPPPINLPAFTVTSPDVPLAMNVPPLTVDELMIEPPSAISSVPDLSVVGPV
ncbi:hypothetical protein [Methyloligella halotolerans]|nr:hypothetical protein [Methyloligella halotolerans]